MSLWFISMLAGFPTRLSAKATLHYPMVNLTQFHPYTDSSDKFDIPGCPVEHPFLSERTGKKIGSMRFGSQLSKITTPLSKLLI